MSSSSSTATNGISFFSSTASASSSSSFPPFSFFSSSSSSSSSGRLGPRSSPPVPPLPPRPSSGNRFLLYGLIGFVCAGFVFPFYYLRHHNQHAGPGHFHTEGKLSVNAVSRGAYLNSGSKDIGPDDTFFKKHAAMNPGTTALEHRQAIQQKTREQQEGATAKKVQSDH